MVKGGKMAMKRWVAFFVLAVWLPSAAWAQQTYTVQFTTSAPLVNGVIAPGEYTTTEPLAGGFRLLRTPPPGSVSPESIQWGAVWDLSALYIYVEGNYTTTGTGGTAFTGGELTADDMLATGDDIEFFLDPNRDGEPNNAGDTNDDSYQIIIPLFPGTGTRDSSNPGPPYFYTQARTNALFGDNVSPPWNPTGVVWSRTVTNGVGFTVELKIPFAALNASSLADSGLLLSGPPVNGDQWYFNVSRIASSGNLPLWNYHAGDANPLTGAGAFFAERPHGVITFDGRPVVTAARDFQLFQ
jgi:hypothetical protein